MCHCSSLYKPKKTPFVLLGALFSLVRKTQFCCFRCVVPNFVVLGVCSSLFKIPKNCLLKKKKISPIFSFWVCHSCFFKNPIFFLFWVHCSSLYKNPKKCCKIVQFCVLNIVFLPCSKTEKLLFWMHCSSLYKNPHNFFYCFGCVFHGCNVSISHSVSLSLRMNELLVLMIS